MEHGVEGRGKATLQMIVCACLWSIAGIFMKFIPWHPFALAGMRSLFAAASVVVYMLVSGTRFRFNRNTVLSAVFLAGTFLCFSTANKLTTAANAIVLQFTAPVFILLFELITHRRRGSAADILSVIVTVLGVGLFVFDSLGAGSLWGNLIALVSGMTMAGMFLCVGETPPEEKMSGILCGHLLTALVGIPFVFLTHTDVSGRPLLFVAILGIVQLGIPYILLGLSVGKCPPLAACLISAIEPLLNPLWVALFYGEVPGPLALLGGVLVVAAVTFYCICDRKRSEARVTA